MSIAVISKHVLVTIGFGIAVLGVAACSTPDATSPDIPPVVTTVSSATTQSSSTLGRDNEPTPQTSSSRPPAASSSSVNPTTATADWPVAPPAPVPESAYDAFVKPGGLIDPYVEEMVFIHLSEPTDKSTVIVVARTTRKSTAHPNVVVTEYPAWFANDELGTKVQALNEAGYNLSPSGTEMADSQLRKAWRDTVNQVTATIHG